ncbi:MAG: threonylcarbamoyl-AMP synthase [Bacteroidia bacterium]|nr:threonylcarbamoyl-AMP synthase [Bacteroidia bacterium]MCO5254763.1 L-threonylcarbamoyladenylate synthase [Bacteroidota bacterium]
MEYFETFEWNPDNRIIEEVSKRLENGEIGIVPTDTIYAIVCGLNNKRGIERICKLIGKKPEKANLSVIFPDLKNISEYTQSFSTSVYKILKRNLPGPFTFILKANSNIPKLFLNNRKTLGIRIPDNKITIKLTETLGYPLVSTSVHSEDEILDYQTDPTEIESNFSDKVDFMIASGSGGNIPSTVIDLTEDVPIIIRQAKGELV